MLSRERPPPGSGTGRLVLAVLALSPVLGTAYLDAIVARRRFATPEVARRALVRLRLGDMLRGRTVDVEALGGGKSSAVTAVRLVGNGPPVQLVLKKVLPFG